MCTLDPFPIKLNILLDIVVHGSWYPLLEDKHMHIEVIIN